MEQQKGQEDMRKKGGRYLKKMLEGKNRKDMHDMFNNNSNNMIISLSHNMINQ